MGLLPLAPGSWASLAALAFGWEIGAVWGPAGLVIAAGLAFAIGCWASARLAQASGRKDPGFIVIDEIAAQWLVLVAAPRDGTFYALAFLAFRLSDIAKPWPAHWIDRHLPGGVGIMLDDVAAAAYAVLVLLAVRAFAHV